MEVSLMLRVRGRLRAEVCRNSIAGITNVERS